MKPLVVFIAGPYSAETEFERLANVKRAMSAGRTILHKGHWPFIPHLTHYYDEWHDLLYDFRPEPETYMQWDFAILRRCDGLLFLASSTGADRELALARELGLLVWTAVGDVPAVIS